MRPVAFVIRVFPCELLEHFVPGRSRLSTTQLRCGRSWTSSGDPVCDLNDVYTWEEPEIEDTQYYRQGEKDEDAHRSLHILCIILAINIARRCFTAGFERNIEHLGRQAILQVKKARLANVLHPRTCLTDHRGLVARTCARVPTEDGKWSCTCATRSPKLLFCLMGVKVRHEERQ